MKTQKKQTTKNFIKEICPCGNIIRFYLELQFTFI